MAFSKFRCVAFTENALFKNSGVINFAGHHCLPRSPTTSQWINETAIASFQHRVCMCSNSSHSTTDSSILGANCQASWLSSVLTADVESRAMCILVVTLLILLLFALVVRMVDVLLST